MKVTRKKYAPTINLHDKEASKQLFNALLNKRFAIVENHNVRIDLLPNIYSEWKNFFNSKDKFSYIRNEKNDEGYIPENVEHAKDSRICDCKEFYQTHYKGRLPINIDVESTKVFLDSLVKLTEKVVKIIDENLPSDILKNMQMPIIKMIEGNKKHAVRIIHYPPVNSENKKLERAGAHGDICLLTMIAKPTDRGLEFIDANGNYDEPVIKESSIIIFNSDMLEMCTNGYFKSAQHRVKMCDNQNPTESRYSIPFFVHPNRNVVLKEGYTAFDFLQNRLTEIGYNGNHLVNDDY